MTENPAVPTNDAALLLDAVKDKQSTVRLYTMRGGVPEILALILAQGLGVFADPGRLDYSTPRIVVGAISVVVVGVLTVQYMRRRHNLGGRVGLPTWVAAVAVFLGNVIALHVAHGDAREIIRGAVLGAALVGLGIAYRSAVLFLFGGVLALALPAGMRGWPVAVWLVPMVLWVLVVGFLGRKQLRERMTI